MPEYRRRFEPGGTYFFTLVTYRRMSLFHDETARKVLRASIEACQAKQPFEVIAIVLLPDHLHTMWKLPAGDADYPSRLAAIKSSFTHEWLALGGFERKVSQAKSARRRRGVWQPRFIEHTIRDYDDFDVHFDYLHYNSVKHGLVACPSEWPYSTFQKYVKLGWYPADWCCPRGGAVRAPQFTGVGDVE
jgi:putative transposase